MLPNGFGWAAVEPKPSKAGFWPNKEEAFEIKKSGKGNSKERKGT